MKTFIAFLMSCSVAVAGDISLFERQARPVSLFSDCGHDCRCEDCGCEECRCVEHYTPQVIGMVPVENVDGTVTGAVANYAEARRMAVATGRPLVVLVGQSAAVVGSKAEQAEKSNAIVCVPSGEEVKLWKNPGVYEYELKGASLFTKAKKTQPALTIPLGGGCANGRCYR